MNLASIKRQLDAAEAIIRPANSFAARLKKLSPEDRAIYDEYQRVYDRWYARATRFRDPGDVYRLERDGEIVAPELPKNIRDQLYGNHDHDDLRILATDTEAEAAEKYGLFVERLRR